MTIGQYQRQVSSFILIAIVYWEWHFENSSDICEDRCPTTSIGRKRVGA